MFKLSSCQLSFSPYFFPSRKSAFRVCKVNAANRSSGTVCTASPLAIREAGGSNPAPVITTWSKEKGVARPGARLSTGSVNACVA